MEILIDEELFYNRLKCDAIRDIVKDSPSTFEFALEMIKISGDPERDSFIIKKMKSCGVSDKLVRITIKSINN